ncbi:MAG: glycosyltransferase family 1 protein [Planctomycetota bacterium]
MRIGLDAMLLSGRYSGVENYILNLTRHLGGAPGAEVTAFVPRGFRRAALRTHGPVCIRRALVGGGIRSLRIAWEQLWLPFKLVGSGVDLVHFPGSIHPITKGIATVLTVHDAIAVTTPDLCDPGNTRYYARFMPRSVARATRIITPTAAVKDDICRLFKADPGRVDVIPMGTDIAGAPAAAPVRRIYGLGDAPYILFVGNREPKKGLVLLVKALFAAVMHRELDCWLVIAGHKGWRQGGFERLLRELGPRFGERVIMPGYVPEAHLAGLYREATLFVFPSLLEGFGIPPLEAMACGTPVLLSDTSALREVYQGHAHFFRNGDLPDLRTKLETLMTDPAQRLEHAAGAREWAAGMTWAQCAQKTLATYRQAIRDHSGK